MSTDPEVEDLLRELAPQVLGVLVRRYGDFDAAEDSVQEAMLAASVQWPDEGVPANPRGWLVTVAARRLTDEIRSNQARRRRESTAATLAGDELLHSPAADEQADTRHAHDDTLTLLFLCCHPALTAPSQVALTLRAVGGLTTAQIARAFLVPETTMAQRISRAKQMVRQAGATFRMPSGAEWGERLGAVLHVLYLVFNEGYISTSGPELHDPALTDEAIRLTRSVWAALPDDGEVAGLLALMLLTDARRTARVRDDGALVPLTEQDRTRWDRDLIAEGITLVTNALSHAALGPYQLQAAIAAIHDEADHVDDTDWLQVLALYELLARISPNPMVLLNHAVAVAMVRGPDEGLTALHALESDRRLSDHHRLLAVRAHLLEMAGDRDAAVRNYHEAAQRTTSLPEQRYLEARAARLADEP